ncbi:MAG: hypothetical protein A2145_04495 [candidate division Zixibacteria bacterium RBG_16_40_9]|nr:MAG: hypothetical protein A2145_04495 [candidate division Zixibacteria bacterium RBG_16_40_9]
MAETSELVKEILSGNTRAFENLIQEYRQLVSHIVFRMIPNPQDREDICQEVFIKVYQNLADFRFESKLSTWMAQIAYNLSINYLRQKKMISIEDLAVSEDQEVNLPAESIQPDKSVEEKDISQRLKNEIDNLPLQFRAIVTLFHLDQMSYDEIGKILNLPEGTVKSYLFRARKLLKERLLSKYQLEDIWQ